MNNGKVLHFKPKMRSYSAKIRNANSFTKGFVYISIITNVFLLGLLFYITKVIV